MKARPIVAAHGRASGPRGGQKLSAYERGQGSVFTPRQLEVATLLADGLTAKEIARRLFLAPETVKAHMKALRFYTNRHTAAGAVAYLLRRDLID